MYLLVIYWNYDLVIGVEFEIYPVFKFADFPQIVHDVRVKVGVGDVGFFIYFFTVEQIHVFVDDVVIHPKTALKSHQRLNAEILELLLVQVLNGIVDFGDCFDCRF